MSKFKNLFLLFTLILSAGLSLNSYAGIVCGDGIVSTDPNIFEECDTGQAATTVCNNNTDPVGGNGPCFFTICGDSITQSPNGVGFNEECDDGGASATCSAICQTITATTTTTAATTTTTTAASTTTTTGAATTTTTVVVPTTTTTAVATTTTAAPTTTTTAAATTTTTQGGGPTTTTTAAATTTTTVATTSTTTAATTTTTQISGGGSGEDLFDFGGSGCTISNTQSAGMDPIWLFLLIAPGLGLLRRRRIATVRTTRGNC